MDSKILVRSFVIEHDFCFEIQKVTWNALSAGVFSVVTLLLRSRFSVITQLFFDKTAAEKRVHSWLCLWSNEQTNDVSESAKDISRPYHEHAFRIQK